MDSFQVEGVAAPLPSRARRVSLRAAGWAAFVALSLTGCAGPGAEVSPPPGVPMGGGASSQIDSSVSGEQQGYASIARAAGGSAGMAQNAKLASPADQVENAPAAIARKIILRAEVTLAAENLTTAEQTLRQLVRQHRGYISGINISGATGGPRSGTWTIRVPSERFDAFMSAATRLGELQSLNSSSEEVTEEYYDLSARLTSKRAEERRLLAHLERSTAKLQEILAVERELTRVRGEIEQMQGRQRLLDNLTALTTFTLTINEIKDYEAPTPPTFDQRILRTFTASLKSISEAGQGLILVFVGAAPWLAVIALFLAPVAIALRRRVARWKAETPPITPAPPVPPAPPASV
jgi:hypothetical protein